MVVLQVKKRERIALVLTMIKDIERKSLICDLTFDERSIGLLTRKEAEQALKEREK